MDRKGFSFTISQENISINKIFQYSKKHKNFKRTKEDTVKIME